MVSPKRSLPRRIERRYSPAPPTIKAAGFEVIAARSALGVNLPPSVVLRHACAWSHDLGQSAVTGDELVGLMAAHIQLGCE